MQEILVIDDDELVREALRRQLERVGYRVRVALDGVEGLAQMRERPPEVVITDIIMPRLNGVEVIASIRREFPNVRIIAISGGGNYGPTDFQPNAITTSAYLAAADKAGADLILTKPFESADLFAAIARALATGRA
jgi:CheY-like chemotaxis protein